MLRCLPACTGTADRPGGSHELAECTLQGLCVFLQCHVQGSWADAVTCVCRERGRSGSSSGGLGGASGGGQSELQLQRQRLITRRKALQKKLSEVSAQCSKGYWFRHL